MTTIAKGSLFSDPAKSEEIDPGILMLLKVNTLRHREPE